jgi:L-arabinose isomerase
MAVELRVGLFGIGLATYWAQFAGLEERLRGYVGLVEERLKGPGRAIVNLGLVDSVDRAYAVGHEARREDVDLLVIYVTTYALSSTVLPIVRRAGVPVIVLNVQPEAALDYAKFNALPDRTAMTGEWLAFCSSCPVPELANVFQRAGIRFHEVVGVLEGDPQCWDEVEGWMKAAGVVVTLNHLRLGLMGHYYSGMLDIATDLTAVAKVFGAHLEMLEVEELSGMRGSVAEEAVSARVARFAEVFDVQADCPAHELERAARTSVALDAIVERYGLGAMAYYAMGSGNAANEDTMSSIILGTSLLTARGVAVAGEYEVKNVLAMKIMDGLGAGGSFTEYYAIDFKDDVVLMGHDGPGHMGIAEGRTKVRPLEVYHGKVGSGLSVEMSVRSGPCTLLSVVECSRNGYKLVFAEGEVMPGETMAIGNTNSRFRFAGGARRFVKAWNAQGPAHHCAVGVGHVGAELEKVASLLHIDAVRV